MRVLFISPTGTHPQHEGNWERLFQLASASRELGHDTYLLHFQIPAFGGEPDLDESRCFWGDRIKVVKIGNWKGSGGPRSSIWTTILLRLSHLIENKSPSGRSLLEPVFSMLRGLDGWMPSYAKSVVDKIQADFKPDVVIVEYAIFSGFFRFFAKETLKIIDTHDKFTNRHLLTKSINKKSWISLTRNQEREALLRADRVIAIQNEEVEFFRKISHNRIPVFQVEQLAPVVSTPLRSKSALVIGLIASKNVFNIEGFNWFLHKIWPLILASMPRALLHLAGSICDHVADGPGIVKMGWVEDRCEFYAGCRFVINPVTGGTGLKIKSVESLRYGLPLITTSHGASGLAGDFQSGFVIADDAREFAEACLRWLGDGEEMDLVSKAAQSYSTLLRRKSMDELMRCLSK